MILVARGRHEIAQLISDLAASALREVGLLLRPIPFFKRFDRIRGREGELNLFCEGYLDKFDKTAIARILRSYTFAGEFSREVLRNFYPSLPEEAESALRTLWGAAVAIDQLLDEDGLSTASLEPLREWVAGRTLDSSASGNGRITASDPRLNALASMLEDTLTDCRRRATDASLYAAFKADLLKMLDAELASPSVTLDGPPVERVRQIVRDKSVSLVRVGFQACSIGARFDPAAARDFQEICDAIGEILWIMDDLIDLEEDLDRGIWNRTLWRLYDDVREERFRELTASKPRLAQGIINSGLVAREIDEISRRVEFLETHPRINDPVKVRALISFWLTSWTGIYW